jgi:hypothetical protein
MLNLQTKADLESILTELAGGDPPESATAHDLYWYVKAALGLDRWREASAVGKTAVERFPDDLELATLYGRSLYRAGRLTEYNAFFDDLLQRFPDHPAINLEIAKLFLGSRDPELAAKYLRLARTGEPLHPEILLTLGHIRFFMNSFEEAAIYYQRFLDIAPEIYPYDFARELVPSFLDLCKAYEGKTLYNMEWTKDEIFIPLEVGDRVAFATMEIPGHGKANLLFDTGGGMFLSLTPKTFRNGGGTIETTLTLHGIGGKHASKVEAGLLPKISWDGLLVKDCFVICLDLSPLSSMLEVAVDGIFGPGWLLACHITLDLEEGEMYIRRATIKGQQERLPLGNHETFEEETGRAIRISFFFLQDSKPLLPIKIEGEEFWFILDSGAEKSALSRSLFERFVSLDETSRQEIQGVGIGEKTGLTELLIARKLPFEFGGQTSKKKSARASASRWAAFWATTSSWNSTA